MATRTCLFQASTGSDPSYPTDFPEYASDSNLCASGVPLAAGSSCDIAANFNPIAAGANTGNIVLTDNALNNAGSAQTIALSGPGVASPSTTTLTGSTTTLALGNPLFLTATG